MKIVTVETNKQKKQFIAFIYNVYQKDENFKDTLIGVVKTFLNKSDTFTKECSIRPVQVYDDFGKILVQAMFIYHPLLEILQVGFFDALEGQTAAVETLMEEMRVEAKKFTLSKFVIGLNGHVSYGVGLLCNHFDHPIAFDSLYNKATYLPYFDAFGFKKTTLSTYSFSMDHVSFPEKIVKRSQDQYQFRTLNLKRFKEEMILFGELCNEALKDTYLYFPRPAIGMYELLKELKPFLKSENLIFAMKDGKEIGFVFWHPDFNQIMPGGKKNSMLEIGLHYLFQKHHIHQIVINAIGIVEAYKRSTVAMGLMVQVFEFSKNHFIGGETNFVWDNNVDSTLLNKENMDQVYRQYCVYEGEV